MALEVFYDATTLLADAPIMLLTDTVVRGISTPEICGAEAMIFKVLLPLTYSTTTVL